MAEGFRYTERAPLPALAGVVRSVWLQVTGASTHQQRDLPTGGAELSCLIGDAPQFHGPLTTARVRSLPPGSTLVGVRFQPGAAAPIAGVPVHELVDLSVPLESLWGRAGSALAEAIAGSTPDAALDLLQRRIATRAVEQPAGDRLVTEAVRLLMPWRPMEIRGVSAELAISVSQLRRRCVASVGIGPKTLQRILRFQGCLALAQAGAARSGPVPASGLADLAAAAGYADHAHLSRECLRLTGRTPGAVLGDTERCAAGHDHRASYRPFLTGRSSVRQSFC